MQQRLTAQFPNYDISLEYYHSGDLAAKLQAEGADTACDIVFDCEYGYLQMLSDNFATIDFIDNSQFVADMQDPTRKYMPVDRYSGSVIVNTQVFADKGLPVPQSYEDLLDPMYKGLDRDARPHRLLHGLPLPEEPCERLGRGEGAGLL